MKESDAELLEWKDVWQRTTESPAASREVSRRLARARRERIVVRIIEGAVAIGALGLVALALVHAANALEAALGLVVGLAISAIWIQRGRIRLHEQEGDVASTVEYLGVLRRARQQRKRLAEFVWIVVILDFVFLIPWWIIGSRFHHRSLTDGATWISMWLPILGFISLCLWALRVWRSARLEMGEVDRLSASYRDEGTHDS
jgi:hypothetical protein